MVSDGIEPVYSGINCMLSCKVLVVQRLFLIVLDSTDLMISPSNVDSTTSS